MASEDYVNAYFEDTSKSLAGMIAEGSLPFQRKCSPAEGLPISLATGNPITNPWNVLVSKTAAQIHGWQSDAYATFQQVKQNRVRGAIGVKKGEHGVKVTGWSEYKFEPQIDSFGRPEYNPDGTPITNKVRAEKPVITVYSQFAAEQIAFMGEAPSGPEMPSSQELARRQATALAYIKGMSQGTGPVEWPTFTQGQGVVLPEKMPLNEATLSVGLRQAAAAALDTMNTRGGLTLPAYSNRLSTEFGTASATYIDRLRSEITGYMLCLETGVGFTPPRHNPEMAEFWANCMKENPQFLPTICADAKKIANYIKDQAPQVQEHDQARQQQMNVQNTLQAVQSTSPAPEAGQNYYIDAQGQAVWNQQALHDSWGIPGQQGGAQAVIQNTVRGTYNPDLAPPQQQGAQQPPVNFSQPRQTAGIAR